MRKIFQPVLLLCITAILFSGKILAQSPQTQQEKVTDSIVQLIIQQINNSNFDSVYAQFGESFKQRLPYTAFKNASSQLSDISPFYNVQYKKSYDGSNSYRVQTKDGPFQIIAGLDSINKIKKLQINPYTGEPAEDKYKRQEAMIPMRDGIKLHTVIFTPVEQKVPLPFLLERTPYGVEDNRTPEKNG